MKKPSIKAVLLVVMLAALLGTVLWARAQTRDNETEVAFECPAIFGVEVPDSKTPDTTFRHQKIQTATILSQLEIVALTNPGDAEANRQFEKAWRIWNSCFNSDRLHKPPLFL